jgi:putative transposase
VDSQTLKSTGVGGKERGFDPAKKVEGRKRHLLVDTEGLVLEARVHSARVPDQDGIRLLLEPVRDRFARLSHLWVDAGYQGRGKGWAEEAMGLSVKVVRKPRKPLPGKVAERWAAEWAKEGRDVDWRRLMAPKGFRVLPRRWVVERTFAWISHKRRMAKDYERLCATGAGLRLRRDDEAHGEAFGPCVGVSRQSLEGKFSEVRMQDRVYIVREGHEDSV